MLKPEFNVKVILWINLYCFWKGKAMNINSTLCILRLWECFTFFILSCQTGYGWLLNQQRDQEISDLDCMIQQQSWYVTFHCKPACIYTETPLLQFPLCRLISFFLFKNITQCHSGLGEVTAHIIIEDYCNIIEV